MDEKQIIDKLDPSNMSDFLSGKPTRPAWTGFRYCGTRLSPKEGRNYTLDKRVKFIFEIRVEFRVKIKVLN